jgi:cytochrome c-type biogenesis protein CcmF
VLLGTFYPLVLEVVGAGRVSVGAPYFDTIFVPLMAPAVFLMGVGPLARWQRASLPDLWTRLRGALLAATLAGVALPLAIGRGSPLTALGLALAIWLLLATLVLLREHWPTRAHLPLSWWGMVVAHLGVAAFVAGVTLVRSYESERDLRMAPGDTVAVAGYMLRFEGITAARGPNFNIQRGNFDLARNGRSLRKLLPEKRYYDSLPARPMTEAAIDSGFTGDLYIALGEEVTEGAWTVRVHRKPFVTWIWGGCLLMVGGGLLAFAGRRGRVQTKTIAGPASVVT